MEPHIAAIMARLDARQGQGTDTASSITQTTQGSAAPKPPLSYEEFMTAEKLTEWPQRLTSEGLLDLEQDRALIGTQDDLYQELKKATPVDMHFLQQLEDRLQALTGQLENFADKIVVPPVQETLDRASTAGKRMTPAGLELTLFDPEQLALKKEADSSRQGPQLKKAFLTDLSDSDMLKVHPSRKGKKASNFKESLIETKRRGIESCVFPGFRKRELTELPGQLEAPQILNRVTKAQDFNPGFKKFWKKIFQSEASVAIMQDAFWWIFLQRFQRGQQDVKDKLFNRIADSFVALFTSINPEVKDKFFQVYGDCLAQALCAAYHEAFPESQRHFQDNFKQDLVNVTSEWVSGFCPPPGTWQKWRLDRLEPKNNKMSDDGKTAAAKSILDAAAGKEGKNEKNTLELDDFMRMVNKLGDQGNNSSRVGTAIAPNSSRDVNKLASVASVVQAGMNLNQMTISRQAVCGTPRRQPDESHTVGPGPDIERVLFNLKGQSPLVAHYLRMRQLKEKPVVGRRVRRTQVSKQKGETTTYRQLINETMAFSETLSKEYQKICEQTNADIAKIERQQREINADIDRLKRDLVNTKNPTDLKIFSERILDKREQALAARQVTKNGGTIKPDTHGSEGPHSTSQDEVSTL